METAREIVSKLIGEWNTRLAGRGVTLEFSEAAVDLLLHEGFSEQYGARNLERTMDRLLGKKLADLLLAGWVAEEAVLRVEVVDGELRVG